MASKLAVLVVNIDNLRLTKECVFDLMSQMDNDFDLTMVDNGSTEPGTKEYFGVLGANGINVIMHPKQQNLCWIWNDFFKSLPAETEYFCLLNNDVRVCCNFTTSIKEVFEKEPKVGCVVHVTNNSDYQEAKELEYKVQDQIIRQGWDMSFRKTSYNVIPEDITNYFGDDYLYSMMYKAGWSAACILSSPMIHYMGQSGKSTSDAIYHHDEAAFEKTGLNRDWDWSLNISKVRMQPRGMHLSQTYNPLLTVNMVSYQRHLETDRNLRRWMDQTDPRLLVDLWNDGPDNQKFELVRKIDDHRIIYRTNEARTNQYGHDMRHKSIMACTTPWWCTTNDDNIPSPYFVEEVLKAIKDNPDADAFKISVGMWNLPVSAKDRDPMFLQNIMNGNHDHELWKTKVKVLDPALDICGDVDAASYIIKTDLARKVGWKHMEFHGDFLFWEEILAQKPKVVYINKVLEVHL